MLDSRRSFIKKAALGTAGISFNGMGLLSDLYLKKTSLKFGLVTYQWGKDWDLTTLISNCEKAEYEAVELRTEHAHAVETALNAEQRAEVKRRFADSPVTCVGYGSNFEYHMEDQNQLQWNIDQTKEYIKLCHDIGATGLKVKPNTLPPDVPREKTIEQIAASLNEVGGYASDYGQLIRVEVHGPHTQELPNMKAIFDQVTDPNVKICWNSNSTDLNPPGLESNFNLVKQWLGDTVHVHELNTKDYPYQELFNLLTREQLNGWILIEASSTPEDRVAAMKEQKAVFNELTAI